MNQQSKYSTHGNCKLNEAQVIKIRDLLIEGQLTYKRIAKMFGVSSSTIELIDRGKTWTHVEGIGVKLKTTRIGGAKLDETQVAQIRNLLIEGELTYKQIAEMFGVSFANIRVINAGKIWTHVEGIGSKIRVMKKKGEGDVDLDETQVIKIRDLLIEGKLTMKEIGAIFGVSFHIIRLINNGEIWTHVEGIGSKIRTTKRSGRTKLNTDLVKEIRDLLIRGDLTLKEIGERFGVSHQTISSINEGKIWTDVEGIGSKLRTKK